MSGNPTTPRKLLISPFKSRNRPRQGPGTSDASKRQSGLSRNLFGKPFEISKSVYTSFWHQ
jgi:hypothetical protein